jgi:hypothetical protein
VALFKLTEPIAHGLQLIEGPVGREISTWGIFLKTLLKK